MASQHLLGTSPAISVDGARWCNTGLDAIECSDEAHYCVIAFILSAL